MSEIESTKGYIAIPQVSSKELNSLERAMNRLIDYINSISIDKEKEGIVRSFLTAYRSLCSTTPEVLDMVPLTKVLVLLNNALINEYYINGAECALVYSFRQLSIKQNLRYLAHKYTQERNLILTKEAFTKRAIEYITQNNMVMPKQMADLPAEFATEKIDLHSLHGINIVFTHCETGETERARYYTVEYLCEIARKKIINNKMHEPNGKASVGPWASDPIEMFKKTALRNILKDAIFL